MSGIALIINTVLPCMYCTCYQLNFYSIVLNSFVSRRTYEYVRAHRKDTLCENGFIRPNKIVSLPEVPFIALLCLHRSETVRIDRFILLFDRMKRRINLQTQTSCEQKIFEKRTLKSEQPAFTALLKISHLHFTLLKFKYDILSSEQWDILSSARCPNFCCSLLAAQKYPRPGFLFYLINIMFK